MGNSPPGASAASPPAASTPTPAAPAAAPAAPATPPSPPTPPESAAQPPEPASPPWLPERLEQAKRTATHELVTKLGFKSVDDATATLTKLRELEQSTLTEQQKKDQELEALRPLAASGKQFAELFGQLVSAQFEALPEAQKTAIDGVAKGDAVERWKLMSVFAAAGIATAPPAPPPAPAAQPATTVPAGTPPVPPPPATPKTKFQEWDDMRKTNPTQASFFYTHNALAIENTRPAA